MTAPARTVALVGLRCVGKSSVGRRLAELTGREFIDLDDRTVEAARAAGEKVDAAGELLVAVGQERFRRFELSALEATLGTAPGCVLATGGGVIETAEARERLRRDAVTIWLRAELPLLQARLRRDGGTRPSLTGEDPTDELAVLLKHRAPRYREVSMWRIDCGDRSANEVARDLAARLENLATSS